MNRALIWYNIKYYVETLKFIAPLMVFVVFHAFIYSQRPIPIWSQYYLTAMAVFVFANWIGASFINSEDRTQQYITRLHVKNETTYHIAKIITILLLLMPLYALLIFYPVVFGFFVRSLLVTEVLVAVVIHFLFSLMGASVGVFFNVDFHRRETALPLLALVIVVMVIPLDVIFHGNALVRYAVLLLPPLNFLSQRLHDLDSDVFVIDSNFLIFVLYSLGYSLILIATYVMMIQKKNKY